GYPGIVSTFNQFATVNNFGTIAGSNNSNGVNLLSGGTVLNGNSSNTAATITAPHTAVYIGGRFGNPISGATGSVLNYGVIENTTTAAAAVRLVSGGTVVNHNLIAARGPACRSASRPPRSPISGR